MVTLPFTHRSQFEDRSIIRGVAVVVFPCLTAGLSSHINSAQSFCDFLLMCLCLNFFRIWMADTIADGTAHDCNTDKNSVNSHHVKLLPQDFCIKTDFN